MTKITLTHTYFDNTTETVTIESQDNFETIDEYCRLFTRVLAGMGFSDRLISDYIEMN